MKKFVLACALPVLSCADCSRSSLFVKELTASAGGAWNWNAEHRARLRRPRDHRAQALEDISLLPFRLQLVVA